MNLLQISPYVVQPPTDGGSHRAHGLVKEIPRFGGRVVRYCQGVSSEQYRELDLQRNVHVAEGYDEYRHIHPAHDIAKLTMLLGYPNVFSDRALKFASEPLTTLAADADVVLVREPWQVNAVSDLVDLPIVYSSHNVEAERFEEFREGGYLKKRAYDRVIRLEQTALDAADLVICTSDRDAERYQNQFGYDGPVHIAPNATYRARLREHDPDSPAAHQVRESYGIDATTTVATFVGSDHPPNVKAVKAILTMAEQQEGDIHFLVIGSVCNAIQSAQDRVTFAGFVDDLEPYFDATDIALNPMSSGSGTNIKVLDYFARSLPVISTPFGVRGFDIEDGREAIVTPIENFSDAITALAHNPHRCDRLGTTAHKLVAETYTWETVSEKVYKALIQHYG
ncbi:glycosyltransferase family 4 protein [Haloterrigena sp. SYSU A558-1]|uniref:Glycosyltransferase family 4 protein n=1 Tax=Haloterrigena gelatinilytica TaxID=2741724 RepID=A0ABX2LBD1_9EURY|nr:glycosyltransferase family 4 protein [Haloterrigena gelatinilytica]NUC70862.1 glycosyltransferase family 4 protein [Haloterrigena gelatinilytica]